MTTDQKAHHIRTMATAICIAQYQLYKLIDSTHHELKQKVSFAIKACKGVENYFVLHNDAGKETKQIFKDNFLGDEILLLSELLESCFGLPPADLETIINAINQNVDEPSIQPS